MSQANVELHRHVTEAFNARDIEAIIALSDPSIELHAMPVPRGSVYHGHDGIRQWHRDLEDAWGDEIRGEPEAYFELGEHTVVFAVLHARGRQSGAQVTMPSATVVRWRDGLIVYVRLYIHREDAFRDLAVSEDALEPIAP